MIGFIGAGNMGNCLIKNLVAINSVSSIIIYDKNLTKVNSLLEDKNNTAIISMATSELEVVEKAKTIFLCVKPKDFPALAKLISSHLTKKHIVISVIAGLTLSEMKTALSNTEKLIRVMPNTPSLISKGAGGISFSDKLTQDEIDWTLKVFSKVGYYIEVPEYKMDAITALSGAGPAYMYMIIEALSDSGVRFGLTRQEATQLAAHTMVGAGEMVLQSKKHPMELKDQVTSPGGITIEALSKLEKHGLPQALHAAVKAAVKKSVEIGKK